MPSYGALTLPSREPRLLLDLWKKEQEIPEWKSIEWLSYYQWIFRGARQQPADESELEWLEAQWRLRTLRPSFVMEAAVHQEEFASCLDQMMRDQSNDSPEAYQIIAIDGGPEYARHCFRVHRQNCILPESPVERKDGAFYQQVFDVVSSFNASVIDQSTSDPQRLPREKRRFQDALIATYSGKNAVTRALSAGLSLREAFKSFNEEQRHSWQLRCHPRVVIAENWLSALRCLHLVHRSEIIVSPAIWQSISADSQVMLLSAGLRIGPKSDACVGNAREAIRRRLKAANG